MVALVIFLTGAGVGGCLVLALVSYTALNPVSSALPEKAVPVRLILEREGALSAGRRHAGSKPRYAQDPHNAGSTRVKGRSVHV